jgi:ubiquinone/menaquinone biosynthesis C-methylase UbiE
MTTIEHPHSAPTTKGRVIHSAVGYDLLVWVLTFGRERAFRDRLVRLARLERGQSVLDIGCGTGSLALAAKRRVGPSGSVHGIDAGPEMIARARKKAARARLDVEFTTAVVEGMPFADGDFDAVLSSLMLHHLPRAVREQCVRETQRVLKPGGLVLAVDFEKSTGKPSGMIGHLHQHGGVPLENNVGCEIVESGAVGMLRLNYVLARRASPALRAAARL